MKVKDVVRTTIDREHGDLLSAGLMILTIVIQTPSFFLFKKYNVWHLMNFCFLMFGTKAPA